MGFDTDVTSLLLQHHTAKITCKSYIRFPDFYCCTEASRRLARLADGPVQASSTQSGGGP